MGQGDPGGQHQANVGDPSRCSITPVPRMARPTRDRVMRRCKFIALLGGVLLAGGALLIIASFAQGIGRWIISTPMPSSRTEVAVAEVGGKIYVVGGFGGERELEVYDPGADRWSRS